MRTGLLAILLLCAACVAPAYNDSQFASKAAKTADEATSAIETARLATSEAVRHGLPEQVIDVALSNQEDTLGSISGTFASVQPPSSASDKLRSTVLDLLQAAQSSLEDARIAVRRGDFAGAAKAANDAQDEAKQLKAISDRYS